MKWNWLKRPKSLLVLGMFCVGVAFLIGIVLSTSREHSEAQRMVVEYTKGERPWHDLEPFGPDIVTHLEEHLSDFPTPLSRIYRWIWPYIPARIGGNLEQPVKHELSREKAVMGLFRLGKEAVPALDSLFNSLNDPVENIRIHALDAIEIIGVEKPKAINAIKSSIDNPVSTYQVVWKTAHRGGKVISIRKTINQNRNYRYDIAAVQTLSRLDQDENPFAINLLVEYLSSQSTPLTYQIDSLLALTTLDPITAKAYIATFLKILKAPDHNLHSANLGRLISNATRLVPDSSLIAPELLMLIQNIESDSKLEGLLINSVGVVANLDPTLEDSVRVLKSLYDHSNKHVRYNALYSMTQLTVPDYLKMPVLEIFLNDEDTNIRVVAAGNLYRLNFDRYQNRLKIIETALQTGDRQVRSSALYELQQIGTSANHLLPMLKKMMIVENHPLMKLDLARTILDISTENEMLTLQEIDTLRNHETPAIRNLAGELFELHKNK